MTGDYNAVRDDRRLPGCVANFLSLVVSLVTPGGKDVFDNMPSSIDQTQSVLKFSKIFYVHIYSYLYHIKFKKIYYNIKHGRLAPK